MSEFVQKWTKYFSFRCLKTKSEKTWEIDIYNGIIIQSHGTTKKIIHCSDFSKVTSNGSNVTILKRSPKDLLVKTKLYQFQTENESKRFVSELLFLITASQQLRAFFDILSARTQFITLTSLKKTLQSFDIRLSDSIIRQMLQFNDNNETQMAYPSFYQLFTTCPSLSTSLIAASSSQFNSLPHTWGLKDCLLDWIAILSQSSSSSLPNIVSSPPPLPSPSCLSGERVLLTCPAVFWVIISPASSASLSSSSISTSTSFQTLLSSFSSLSSVHHGALFVTNYRIILKRFRNEGSLSTELYSRYDSTPFFNVLSIPLLSITNISSSTKSPEVEGGLLKIRSKDLRHTHILLPPPSEPFQPTSPPASTGTSSPSPPTGPSHTYSPQVILSLVRQFSFNHPRPSVSSQAPSPCFAFFYSHNYLFQGWVFSDLRPEYQRLGLTETSSPSRAWQVADNTTGQICPTYPSHLILPSCMPTSEIEEASRYRSQRRLPAVTYQHSVNALGGRDGGGGVIARCAQPVVGWLGRRSEMDELLLNLIRNKGLPLTTPPDTSLYGSDPKPVPKLYIFDARREIAAALNQAMGKGTEVVDRYLHSDLVYCNIDNIHVMRDSLTKIANLMLPGGAGSSRMSVGTRKDKSADSRSGGEAGERTHGGLALPQSGEELGLGKRAAERRRAQSVSRASISLEIEYPAKNRPEYTIPPTPHNNQYDAGPLPSTGYWSGLQDSRWLSHIQLILRASTAIAEKIHLEGSSVLIHCSDGWDRTSQLSSISQILLDPYYRTVEGLAVLIEKEWCSFGYKFEDRNGLGLDPSSHPNERSPIFFQFLDTLHQLLRQFPLSFQYTEELLIFLADHQHSGLFGTFLFNSELIRKRECQVMERTQSIWSHVFDPERLRREERGILDLPRSPPGSSSFLPISSTHFFSLKYRPLLGPIWPSWTPSSLRVWARYFSRWDPLAHPHPTRGESWRDDWGDVSPLVESPLSTLGIPPSSLSQLTLPIRERPEGGLGSEFGRILLPSPSSTPATSDPSSEGLTFKSTTSKEARSQKETELQGGGGGVLRSETDEEHSDQPPLTPSTPISNLPTVAHLMASPRYLNIQINDEEEDVKEKD